VVGVVGVVDCCFSEIGSVDATAGATACATACAAGCPPPPTRPFGFVFIVFKVNISPSLGIAAIAGTDCLDCVEAEGLKFALTTEAQDFIECIGTL
jgi:hypothetical protein